MEGILSLIKQGHMLQSPWRTPKLPQKNTTKALKYNEDEPIYSMLTVDALDHTRSVSFSFCLYVGDIFVLICSARCSCAGKVKYREVGQCLFLSVLFSYFGDSTVVHQIGTQSTVGSLPEAHCIFFFFCQGGSRFVLSMPACLLGASRQGTAQHIHVFCYCHGVEQRFDENLHQ